MAKSLERFTITRAADDYLITIEDDNGDTIELTASEEQLELIGEELERAIDEDDISPLDDGDDDEIDEEE